MFKDLYSIVKQPVLSKIPTLRPGQLSPGWVVQNFGSFELRRDYYGAFQNIGGLLLGTDAILYHWAEFTARLQKNSATPEMFEKVFLILTETYEEERQVADAKQCYVAAMQTVPINCVWCPSPLVLTNFAIDHVLPFSVTHNNNLWNLLPSCKNCNSSKSDSIPKPDFLLRRKQAIFDFWRLERTRYPEAFEQEVRYDLIGFEEPTFRVEPALMSLAKRCEFLIKEN